MKSTTNPHIDPQEVARLTRKTTQALRKSFFKSPDYATACIHTSALALLTTPLNHYKCALLQLMLKENSDAMFSMLKAADFSAYFYERAGMLSFVNGCYSVGGNAFVKGYEMVGDDRVFGSVRGWAGERESIVVEMMRTGKDCDVVEDYERYCCARAEKNSTGSGNSASNTNIVNPPVHLSTLSYIPVTDTSVPSTKLNYLHNAHVLYKKAQMPKTADLIKLKILKECIIQRKYDHAVYYAHANTDVMRMLLFLNGGEDEELRVMDESEVRMMGIDECGGMLVEEVLGRRNSEYELL